MTPSMSKPIVAVVGRPNVGKSTLFNRLVGRRQAIVEDVPGTTRDRLYGDSEWSGVAFTVVDTGGLDFSSTDRRKSDGPIAALLALDSSEYVKEIRAQVAAAVDEADMIVLVVDAQDGLTAADAEVGSFLRPSGRPIVVAANKADNASLRESASEFYALGLGRPWPVSALHGTGTGDLLDCIVADLPKSEEEPLPEAVGIAIVGRPNVGKSSLLNRLLGEERSIVSAVPGTTRDAVDTVLDWTGQRVVLIDTAGIRRRGKIERGIEYHSVIRALRAVRRSDVALLIVDGSESIMVQDTHIAGYILEEAKSVVVVVNKWDLVERSGDAVVPFTREVRKALRFMSYVPVLFISALTGEGVDEVIPTALRVQSEREMRIPTAELNRILHDAVSRHAPPSTRGKRLRFFYATQAEVDPPTFVLFVNKAEMVHFSYLRYLENRLRERYAFEGTPVRFVLRARSEAQ
jgi:GTP-binding protein